MKSRSVVVVRRALEAVLVLCGLGVLLGPDDASLAMLVAWDVVAIGYVVLRWLEIRRHRSAGSTPADGADWRSQVAGRRAGFAATILASVVGITCGLLIALSQSPATSIVGDFDGPVLFFAVPAVFAAWMVLHLGFAEHYAHLFFRGDPPGGLDFPGTPDPTILDFAYFSVTIGTTFAASDVSVRSREIRYAVMVHSVLSFFYNAAVLGVAITVLTR